MNEKSYGLHWFRRDLRVAGNQALQHQIIKYNGRVIGVFCFDHKFLGRPDFSANRFQFFLKTLKALQNELYDLGSDLLVLDRGPREAFTRLVRDLKVNSITLPDQVTWNKDYEPFARQRDKDIKSFLESEGISHKIFRDHLLIEPNELSKSNGETYQVYSPFARQWLNIFRTPEIQERIKQQKGSFAYLRKLKKKNTEKMFSLTWKKLLKNKKKYPDKLSENIESNAKNVTIEIPEGGSIRAFEELEKFKRKLEFYGERRDFPFVKGTSRLSMYLKNGSITVPQIIYYLELKPFKMKKSGKDTYFSELIWREFYYHILYHHPRVETEAFLTRYNNLKWRNDETLFNAWKQGKTGFPIVDAGMRELNKTGWMHNRVRMIVASFLTKDLLINWQWGEKYFMETLLDGDLAANNGGWQWAASTGCDPQPYFRIFNPWLQGKKFDPNGEYIKKFLPELKNLGNKEIHQPIENHLSYPEPIVDHHEQKIRALSMYKAVK